MNVMELFINTIYCPIKHVSFIYLTAKKSLLSMTTVEKIHCIF